MLHIGEFSSDYISALLCKLSKESSKQIFLLDDFNNDLFKHESPELFNTFLDTLSSSFLLLQIIFLTILKKFLFLICSSR